ncbi:response regulator transcription factor [Haloactinospora alba]|uniref:response regulator transcription factor n=1 Tax=Haloactinospora alba TaxID=405555 RepID=UPI0014777941|nr:response regulator transcription factor [Haloactinospora alba]
MGIFATPDELPSPAPSVIVVGPECDGALIWMCSRSAQSRSPVFCLDVGGGTSRMLEALHAGASGYCDGDQEDLATGVLNLAAGEKFVPHHLISHLVDAYLRLCNTNPMHSLEVPSGHDLTTREMQVIVLLVDGHTTKEISKRLVISEHTAKNHIRNILAKLDLTKRSEIISWYYRIQIAGFV